MRRFIIIIVSFVALGGCVSEKPIADAPKKEPAAAAPATQPAVDTTEPHHVVEVPSDYGEVPVELRLRGAASDAAKDLRASGRFASDLLDVRGIMDRTSEAIPTGDLEQELRSALVREGFHVLDRTTPVEPDRAIVALPVYGFVGALPHASRTALRFHFEVAREAPKSMGPSRVAWAFEEIVVKNRTHPFPDGLLGDEITINYITGEATKKLAPMIDPKVEALEVQPVHDTTGRFPVLAFDAALRARLVRSGVPVLWRRSPGVDAPPSVAAGKQPEKSLDYPRLVGEVDEMPKGSPRVVLRLERFGASRRWEIFGDYEWYLGK